MCVCVRARLIPEMTAKAFTLICVLLTVVALVSDSDGFCEYRRRRQTRKVNKRVCVNVYTLLKLDAISPTDCLILYSGAERDRRH